MEALWHDDGHVLHLRLDRATLTVEEVSCPNVKKDPDFPCHHRVAECLVKRFVGLYGLDCHVGVCTPTSALRVAWTLVGNGEDLDASQVWVISTQDEAFAAWLITQRGSSTDPSPEPDSDHVGVDALGKASEEVEGRNRPSSDDRPAPNGMSNGSVEPGGESFVVAHGDEVPGEDVGGE